MKLLAKEQWQMEESQDKKHVIASLYEYPKGYRYWDKYDKSNLPNNLIGLNDLERLGVNVINMKPSRSTQSL